MRYIDRTNCKSMADRGVSRNIKSMAGLTRTATKIAEKNGLGVLKRRDGWYRVISECGLGAYEDFFRTLAEVDNFLKSI